MAVPLAQAVVFLLDGKRVPRLGREDHGGRALLRVVGLVIAIVPFFAGFLPVLFDRRRRAIQDMLAGTTVRLDDAHTSEGG